MRAYSLIAPAKINLHLEILGDRPDGYHELAMVMQSISLSDRVEVRANATERLQVHCNHTQVPQDSTNLAYRAAELMTIEFPEAFQRYGGVKISLDKQIPVAAGLAGGSANAAAVLVGIDLLWKLGLTQSELQELGAKIGSDVPFCLSGGTAIATGRGDKISPLPDLEDIHVVLAKYRNLAVSTAWAYQTYRQQFGHNYPSDTNTLEDRAKRVHSGPLIQAIAQHDAAKIGQLMHNDLEKVVLPAHNLVSELKTALLACNPLGTMMSGSGPTVFALAKSKTHAEAIQAQIKQMLPDPQLDTWTAQFCPQGIQVS
ncbi:4-(cytidine 5'-diphospho)-2-C-methyl-D-erythritol kinase [Merismopedia glauca]|uniref:4-diphosphocytidyl-2-C-methyl-D-erythritol kinase n=1 Tax=Merismopedia glauca CCAP 1448/3 TaxID=1296344 RepID=A0A2T1C8S8_9CYAN|nr:4-(cytidine 5'-diphospho)-2-C-methyl-D-erythritol kinase [Merismopedia glauca]PSB04543.1 4-(cytidine 5'-diphospho)-2-C-methyl-D-erythritol kinase [Merismopedia glauca CCAP 1448/3]